MPGQNRHGPLVRDFVPKTLFIEKGIIVDLILKIWTVAQLFLTGVHICIAALVVIFEDNKTLQKIFSISAATIIFSVVAAIFFLVFSIAIGHEFKSPW